MAIPAELMAERAAAWAESDAAVRAMIVYGSLAQGTADEDSDLDVIIVAEPGQRDALWDRREQISDLIHGGHDAIWHQEPLWQRRSRTRARANSRLPTSSETKSQRLGRDHFTEAERKSERLADRWTRSQALVQARPGRQVIPGKPRNPATVAQSARG